MLAPRGAASSKILNLNIQGFSAGFPDIKDDNHN
jgi:hypothetical protein